MRKIISLLLCVAIIAASAVGCGKGAEPDVSLPEGTMCLTTPTCPDGWV